MKFYDRTGKHHKSFVAAMGASILSKIDETLTEKARGYREAGEDRYDETPGAYTGGKRMNEPIVVPYDDGDEHITLTPYDDDDESEPEPKEPGAQKISIDYAHRLVVLEDANGNVIATSPIDEKLVRGTIDGTLLDVLYPDGNIPDNVKMNIQSNPSTAKAVILDANGKPFGSTDVTIPPSDDGACG